MTTLAKPLLLLAALGLAPICIATSARADEPRGLDPNAQDISRFTKARWSMITPDRDYEGGCVVGFLAFEFSPTGYFSYNNHIRGAWRIDELGNLKLRTRDGVRFTMIVDGTTIRPSQTIEFLKRSEVFQRCPE
jgi:hypothetical protein